MLRRRVGVGHLPPSPHLVSTVGYPPFATSAKDGAPIFVGAANKIKGLGHPAS